MSHNLISAIDMAVELVRNSPEPGSGPLFNQVEPLFFELTRRHSAYIHTFDDVIVLMQMPEESIENTYAEIRLFKDEKIVTEKRIEINSIPIDSVKHFSNPPLSAVIVNLGLKEKGIYTIEIKLKNKKGDIISKNSYSIELV